MPISTQWGSQGYYYPIQIAQYGLSHYSKHLAANGRRSVEVIEDGEDEDRVIEAWDVAEGGSLRRTYDKETHSQILRFQTPGEWQNMG